ncbi:hypothetical protein SISNIDRAFT_447915 [Sistotremastrum niveocremeum HHB9708]|uniref:Uncharacterized protein n=1 Tax=Sistotremastrum niveocremeum HHB9708 TaxID=1314777 RepID=A0A165AIR4_9AGAM|nr:hypothetical protein SISNIDRAFT_447915 [Sistotremastrum niveocremeum HHB9708]
MAAKKRCQFGGDPQCNSAALRIVGECSHCRSQFCGTVRNIKGLSATSLTYFSIRAAPSP